MKNQWGVWGMGAMACVLGWLVLQACTKSDVNETGRQPFALYLTDDPARYDALNIDIRYVEVKVDTSNGHHDDDDDDADDDHRGRDEHGRWDTLEMTAGVYNVAALRNGVETLLASGEVEGRVRKVRLTLGTENTVVVNGTTYPLNLLPGAKRYVYLKLEDKHKSVENGRQRVWLDFDISRSVIFRNGQYYLLPKIKPFCDAQFGSLEGKVLPGDADVQVTAFSDKDTATAYPEDDGRFKIRGLQPGTYKVVFDGVDPYIDTTINNVAITRGRPVTLPTVTLKK